MHTSFKWLIGTITVSFVILAPVTVPPLLGTEMLLPYQWYMLLHILGAVMFTGNIIVTAAWMRLAERTKEPAVMHFASRGVNWADAFFTGPGVLLILLNGLALAAARWGGVLETSWITAALALFALSGMAWAGFLLRYQHSLIRLSGDSIGSGSQLPEDFVGVLHRWYAWGVVATVLPFISLFLMVVKPELW